MKTKIIIILLCLSFFSISSVADDPSVGIGTLRPCCDTVSVGDTFNVTLYIDTTTTTTGFTLRQLLWNPALAQLLPNPDGTNCTFLEPWIDPTFNDAGELSNPGNLTYIMANKLGGITGNNTAINITFQALAPGELHINIPTHIWSGQSGLHIDLMDETIWHNTTIMIEGDEPPNHPPTITTPSPSHIDDDIPITLSQLSVTIEDIEDHFDWWITSVPNIGDNSEMYGINGTKICPVSGLSYDTTYTWYVNATDGKSWTNKTYQFTTEEEDSGSPPSNPPSNPPDDPPDENEAPVPVINISGNQTVNETVSFNASSSTDDGEIMNYTWNFGDNTTAFGVVVTHSYNQSGNYTVTLTLTDDDDATATTTVNVSIKNQTSPPDEPPDNDHPDDNDTAPPDDDDDDTIPPSTTSRHTDYTPLIIAIIAIIIIVAIAYLIWEWFT